MKLYATTTSERASKGQGGNEYIETNFFITSKESPQARVRVINDEKMGLIYFSVEEYFFGKWRMKYQKEYFINVSETKGNKKKGDCTHKDNYIFNTIRGKECKDCTE